MIIYLIDLWQKMWQYFFSFIFYKLVYFIFLIYGNWDLMVHLDLNLDALLMCSKMWEMWHPSPSILRHTSFPYFNSFEKCDGS